MSEQPASEQEDTGHRNLCHSERLGTFIEANWWPDTTNSFMYLCTPQKMAQAGLEYHADGEGRCVVCYCVVKNLERTSDPWIRHAITNPDCPLILMGKPSKPDDYTMKQFVELILQRRLHHLDSLYEEYKKEIVKRTAKIVRGDQYLLQRNKMAIIQERKEAEEDSADSALDGGLSNQSQSPD